MPFLYFIVMVGVLVLVHELGHFMFAKYFGVRVLKFSIGFGPRIAGFSRGGTEYVLSALPLGGYVRMLGESPRDDVGPRDETSFENQPIWRRIAIVVGGPLMSLLLPILLYFVVFLGDTQLTPSSVGAVVPGLPADGKLQAGDRITAIDGEPITTFHELNRTVEASPDVPLVLTVERAGETLQVEVTPQIYVERLGLLDVEERVGRIGVKPLHPMAVIGVASDESPAAAARLRTFDVVVAAGGRPMERWVDLERVLGHNRGAMIPVTYLRPTQVPNALGGWARLDVYEPRIAALTPEARRTAALADLVASDEPAASRAHTALQRTGLESADLYVSHVIADSPEHRAGLLPGDRLVSLDGRPIRRWDSFLHDLEREPSALHRLIYRREGEQHVARFRLEPREGKSEQGQPAQYYAVGIRNWVPKRVEPPVPNPHPLSYAFREAFRETAKVVKLTVYSMLRLVQGRLSIKAIGGPLTIFEVAGTAAEAGPLNYLTLMAFISINLGLINLLPIPLLDGGHLPFLVYEAVARRPLSLRIREYAHVAGLVVLLALMVLAFKNDLERQWPRIVERVSGP